MLLLIFISGLTLGSFLNVLIDRLPAGESIWRGRSHCDYCKKTLRWYELIPVVSWLIQGGCCRRCHKSLSIQYPTVELTTAILAVYIFQQFASSLIVLSSYCLIIFPLLVIFITDLKYQIIPDAMIVIGIIGALLRLVLTINYQLSAQPAGGSTLNYFFSALAAAGFFYLIWRLTRGRAMGRGDANLAFLLGLILGFPLIIVALYAAFLTGASVGVILILAGNKTLKSKLAFGPFLIAGTLIAWFWGEMIIQIWKSLF